MRPLLLSVAILLPALCFGQWQEPDVNFTVDSTTHKVVFEKIASVDSATFQQLMKKAKTWAQTDKSKFYSSNGNRNQGLVILTGEEKASDKFDVNAAKADIGFDSEDPENRSILAHGALRYEGGAFGCVRMVLVNYDIIIRCKDGRTKATITNISYTHRNTYQGGQLIPFNQFKDQGDCKSSGLIEELLKCEHCSDGMQKFYRYLNKSCNELLNKFEPAMQMPISKDDNW